MHPTILAKRKARAINEIIVAAEALGNYAELDPLLIEALSPKARDPRVKDMFRLEAVAKLTTALAVDAGLLKENAEEPEPAADEEEATEADATDAAVSTETGQTALVEELPDPVLVSGENAEEPEPAAAEEDAKPKRRAASRKKKK